jgi:hypothetical protein
LTKLATVVTNMAQALLDLVYSFGNCLNCFPGSPTLKINSRSFKILRLLGEVRLCNLHRLHNNWLLPLG